MPPAATSRSEETALNGAVPWSSTVRELNAAPFPRAVALRVRRGTSAPERTAGATDAWSIASVPSEGETIREEVSVWPSHACVSTVARTGTDPPPSSIHEAWASSREPEAAAGTGVPLIQPLQSRASRFASNS